MNFFFNILVIKNLLNVHSIKFLSIFNILNNKTILSRTLTTLNEKILSKHIVFLDFLNKFFRKSYQWMYLHRYSTLFVIRRYLLSIFKYYKLNRLIFLKNVKMQFRGLYNYQPFKTYFFDYSKVLKKSRLKFSTWIRFFFSTVNKYNKFEVYTKYSKLSLFSDVYRKFKYRFRYSVFKVKKNIKKNILLKRFNFFLYFLYNKVNFKKSYFNNLFVLKLKKLFFLLLFKNSYFSNNEILDNNKVSLKYQFKDNNSNFLQQDLIKYKVFYNKYIYFYKKSDFYNFFIKDPKLKIKNFTSSLSNLYLNNNYLKKSIFYLKCFYKFKLVKFIKTKLYKFNFEDIYYKFLLEFEKLKIFTSSLNFFKGMVFLDGSVYKIEESSENVVNFFFDLESHIKSNRLKFKNRRKYNNNLEVQNIKKKDYSVKDNFRKKKIFSFNKKG